MSQKIAYNELELICIITRRDYWAQSIGKEMSKPKKGRKHSFRILPEWRKLQLIGNRWVKINAKQAELLRLAGKI